MFHLKPGDLVNCDIYSFANDTNPTGTHPCLVLELIPNAGVKVAIISHNNRINGKDCYSIDLIKCCRYLGCFIKIVGLQLSYDLCEYDNICNCYVTMKLKFILKQYNIKWYEEEKN